jgi:hypothetical protein
MATILAFPQLRASTPEMTHAMSAAFEGAWKSLVDIEFVASAPSNADAIREALARRIIASAQQGMSDANLLREDALRHCFPETSPRRRRQEAGMGARSINRAATPGDHVQQTQSQRSSSSGTGALWGGLRFI